MRVQVKDLKVGDVVYSRAGEREVEKFVVVGRTKCMADVVPLTGEFRNPRRWSKQDIFTTYEEAVDLQISVTRKYMQEFVFALLREIDRLKALKVEGK